MAKKTKQYEKKIKKLEKGGKDGLSGELKKNGTRGGGRASKKKKTSTTQTNTKSKTPKKSASCLRKILKEHPSYPLEGKKPRIRRCRQRYARKRTREESSALEKRIKVKKEDLENQRRQIKRSIKEKVRDSYGLLTDDRRLEKQNALLIITAMKKWFYFYQTTNLAFHDLKIGKVDPKTLHSLLRLGVNFCPTPLRPTFNIENIMKRFERDLHIWSVFAGREDLIPLANTKIYIISKWKPTEWDILLALKQRRQKFQKALEPKFRFRPIHHNLLPHQRRTIGFIKKNPHLMVVQT